MSEDWSQFKPAVPDEWDQFPLHEPALKHSTELAAAPNLDARVAQAQPLVDAAHGAGLGWMGQVAEAIPEALTHFGHKALAGAAGFVAGAPYAPEGLISGSDKGARINASVSNAVSGAVDTQPKTVGGKALVRGGNFLLGKAAEGVEGVGGLAANIARWSGASPDNVARIGALGEGAASYFAGDGATRLAQMPFKTGMGPADLAKQAAFEGAPPTMGPPLRSDPTLNMGTATTEATPAMIRPNGARLPPVSATDMAGRTDPGLNLGADPLGAPSAAAQPPLMADTRPSMSMLDRIIASGTEKAANKTAMNATKTKNVQDAIEFGWKMTPVEQQGAGLTINQSAAGFAGNAKLGKANSEANAQRATQAIKEDFGLPPGPLHDADLRPILAEAQGSREKIKAVDIPIKSDKQMKADVAAIRGDFAKAAKEFPTQFKDDAIDSLIASLSQKTEFVPGQPSTWGGIVSKRSSPATEPVPAVDVEHTPGALMEFSRNLRAKAADNLKSIKPEDRAIGLARRKAAKAIEDLMDRKLSEAGYTDLVAEHAADRTKMAKVYDTLGALDDATGLINPHVLGRMWDKDKPMTGALETVGRLSRAFKDSSRNLDAMRDTSHFDFLDHATLYSRPLIRAGQGTLWYQKNVVGVPTYIPGMTVNLAQKLNKADPLSLGAAGAINQSNFSVNNPLGLDQQ